MKILTACVAVAALFAANRAHTTAPTDANMNLGAFSISLTVQDLAASRTFYQHLGFEVVGGSPEQNYQILRNGESTIGLFQGMFEQNILTFNPGWSGMGEHPSEFTDVRELQRALKQRGLEFAVEADADSKGPASFVLTDPDGNPILVDQHVD